jgi:quercetin dioxygenase-like cupin family protein
MTATTSDSAPTCNQEWEKHGLFFEYGSAANPRMPKIGIDVFPPSMHHITESKIIPLDLAHKLETSHPATGPNLLAHFVHIAAGEELPTSCHASSQVFYVIRGAGYSVIDGKKLSWKSGDFFALPVTGEIRHRASEDSAFYWVNDQPLMDFLGAKPTSPRVPAALFLP